jgi:hypothetical protein
MRAVKKSGVGAEIRVGQLQVNRKERRGKTDSGGRVAHLSRETVLRWPFLRGRDSPRLPRLAGGFGGPEGKLPFPDGAMIARLAWQYTPSEENNNGKPVEKAALSGCYACHVPVQARDFVFTRYSP